jgi:FecR protein
MKTSKRFIATFLAGLVITLLTGMALAQDLDQDSDNANDDPPGRAADIRYMTGQVSIQPGGVDDWVAAAINRPLTTGDKVWTDKESRTELHLGSSALRLSSETSLTLTNLSDQDVQVELDQGALNLWVRQLYDGEIYEVDTPNLAFTITRSGDYRFDVDPNGDTTLVSVRNGAGEATGDGPGVSVRSGQQVSFSNGQSMQSEVRNLPGADGFDDWCRVRDDRETHSQSAQYVSPDVIGASDLDENGVWSEEPNYGPVWRPSHVDADWAPYHDGHWIWVEPWGWTWVDDAPWGFAPSHYGRWVYTGGYWGWTPGPRVVAVRAVYAPALVAFVGGSNWGVGVSFGGGAGVGWFPLGYNEPYIPPYHTSRNYFTQVNVTNIHVTNVTVINNYYNNRTVVNNIRYVNRDQPRAFVAVSASAMSSGQSVRRVAVNVPRGDIERVSLVRAAPVAPVRNSVLGANAGRQAVAPPARAIERRVVTKTAPPPRPIPFAAKQDALAKNPGRPLDRQSAQQIRAKLPPPPPAPNRGGNDRGANNTVIPNNHPAPPRPGSPQNPNAPRNPGNTGGNPGGNPNNLPANGGNANDRNVPRPNNGSVNPRPSPGNDNPRPGGAEANPNARPDRNQPNAAPDDRGNNRGNNNDSLPRNNNPNTPSANPPRSVPRPPNADVDRGPRPATPPQQAAPPGQRQQPAPDNPNRPAPPRPPDSTNRNSPPAQPREGMPPGQRQQPAPDNPNRPAPPRPPDSTNRSSPPAQPREGTPAGQRQQSAPDNANRPAPRAPAENRPNARPEGGANNQRQAAPADRSVPKPPPAKPGKEEKEKPKDKDKDKDK